MPELQLQKAKEVLRNRLANNQLEDTTDLMSYIQYASRLAALGDTDVLNKIYEIHLIEQEVTTMTQLLKERCELGQKEVENYYGEELAISLIDAQDFYCFELRFGKYYPDALPYLEKWQDACQKANIRGIDDECAEALAVFLENYPIPEEEHLPIINTPMTNTEWALLEYITTFNVVWYPSPTLLAGNGIFDFENRIYTYRPTINALAADGGGPPVQLQTAMSSEAVTENNVVLQRSLNQDWQLQITIKDNIKDNNGSPVEVDKVQLGNLITEKKFPTKWNFSLGALPSEERRRLLEEPIIVYLSNGYCIKCSTPY
jgi:hypothetical protein